VFLFSISIKRYRSWFVNNILCIVIASDRPDIRGHFAMMTVISFSPCLVDVFMPRLLKLV
jgi:hypothetical protein